MEGAGIVSLINEMSNTFLICWTAIELRLCPRLVVPAWQNLNELHASTIQDPTKGIKFLYAFPRSLGLVTVGGHGLDHSCAGHTSTWRSSVPSSSMTR
ncbi:hypothetical protein MPTK1_2g16950 [Marchantia polymorpha subsp. ruderalis]|uniref:Uncharacterized protein n=1 Tax=Marchantia polymorpha TaxID=3197 RepID=A0A2R6WCM9_MARPO|nr:hypothetical protein MARPO_0109s0036 [Marchantia polymorpha]BBN02648.1 hypothetical protein Mp_2g16950 [Marchantia polymorpha subsp. ruderalis]|eukprot:PTQ31606.1 hypothetical protein MARPO_0109s0036 [Marchantia polymorpha]